MHSLKHSELMQTNSAKQNDSNLSRNDISIQRELCLIGEISASGRSDFEFNSQEIVSTQI